jgi:outer membrane translocation and assembly module TamA
VRLRSLQDTVTARPDEVATCKFVLDRTSNFTEAVQLEMMETAGFTAEKVRIDAGSNEAVVQVRLDKSMKRTDGQELRFRATGKLASGGTVVTLATVVVRIE